MSEGSWPAPASSPVLRAQNQPEAISRLRAMAVSHARAQRLSGLSTWLSVLLAAAGLAAAFIPSLAVWVTVAGAAWALAYSAGLGSWQDSEARRAAHLQELLDVRLYRLGWNQVLVGEQPAPHEVSSLSRRFHGQEEALRNYYEIPDLPYPYDVLACQAQNLGWGARVRRRYARAVMSAVLAWTAVGLVVGAAEHLSVFELILRWYIPSLAALLMGVDTFRCQREVASERERVLTLLRARVAGGHSAEELRRLARQVQDVIFQSRLRYTRVPNWFFHRYQSADRTDFQAVMREMSSAVDQALGRPEPPH